MLVITIGFAAALLLTLLLVAIRYAYRPGIWIAKPALSLLFIATALMQTQVWSGFHLSMVAGFLFCLVGDVLLIPRRDTTFRSGLAVFLMGHILYISAFYRIGTVDVALLVPLAGVLVVDVGVYLWMREHIREMRGPILAYMLVISVMVVASYGAFLNADNPLVGRVLLLSGAICFYVSDLFVAREEFVEKSFLNPLLGLPLYYIGQFALAFSLGHIGHA